MMCNRGDERLICVPIYTDNNKFRLGFVGIDSCIAPIVGALNKAKIYTSSSCCGHGNKFGHIYLQDGRVLVVITPPQTKEQLSFILGLYEDEQEAEK